MYEVLFCVGQSQTKDKDSRNSNSISPTVRKSPFVCSVLLMNSLCELLPSSLTKTDSRCIGTRYVRKKKKKKGNQAPIELMNHLHSLSFWGIPFGVGYLLG